MAVMKSSIPGFVRALRDGLRARPGLAGVTVTAAPVSAEDVAPRLIRLGGSQDGEQRIRTFTRHTVEEVYSIEGTIWWIAVETFGDDAIDAAQDGAFGLYAEIEDFLRSSPTSPRVNGTVMRAEASLARYVPTLFDTGTGVVLDFRVRVQNELTP